MDALNAIVNKQQEMVNKQHKKAKMRQASCYFSNTIWIYCEV